MSRLPDISLSLAPARSALAAVAEDLREKRLWPLALLLVLAIVAVPVALSRSSASPAPTPPAATPTTGPERGVPALTVTTTPGHVHPVGPLRDPFAQRASHLAATATATVKTIPASSGGSPAPSTNSTAATTTPTGSQATSRAPATPAPVRVTPAPAPVPAPRRSPMPARTVKASSDLPATGAWAVAIAITNGRGGFVTVDPLERLAPLPAGGSPLLVELGVLHGAKRVLFAVQPDTQVSGSGTCIPGPADCQVLALAPDQIENVASASASGTPVSVELAVTSIRVAHHSSPAAARHARAVVSAIGRKLLSGRRGVLSLFRYEPGTDTLSDLRHLSTRATR